MGKSGPMLALKYLRPITQLSTSNERCCSSGMLQIQHRFVSPCVHWYCFVWEFLKSHWVLCLFELFFFLERKREREKEKEGMRLGR